MPYELIAVAMSLGVALILVGIATTPFKRNEIKSRLDSALNEADVTDDNLDALALAAARRAASSNQDDRLARLGRVGPAVHARLESAGVNLTVSRFILLNAAVAVVLGLLGFLLGKGQIYLAVAMSLLGAYLPWLFLAWRRARRRDAFVNQMVGTIGMLVSGLRSGLSLNQSLQIVAKEARDPTRAEMSRVVLEIELGLPTSVALENLADRIRSRDLDLLVTGLEVQHEVGGDSIMLMETMSDTMRERFKMASEVKVITSQQSLAAKLMAGIPLVTVGILFLISPSYMSQLFSSEPFFGGLPVYTLALLAAVLIALGYSAAMKVGQVDT